MRQVSSIGTPVAYKDASTETERGVCAEDKTYTVVLFLSVQGWILCYFILSSSRRVLPLGLPTLTW